MSKQYPGGLITKTPVTPNSISAPGVWSLSDQAKAQATNTWPFLRDPQFNYVTMLLHGDGSAGVPGTGSGAGASSTVTNFNADASTNNFNVAINGDARSNNFTPYQAGYYSNYFASGAYIRAGTSANLALGSGAWTCESWVFPTSFTTTAGPIWDFRNAGGYISTAPLIHFNTTGTVQYQSTLTSTTAVSLNTWSHIAIVRNGTTVTIYINGVASGTVTDSTTMTNTYCCIGAVNDAPSSYYLTAYVSNARLVVGTAVYTAAFTPTTSPLTAISGTQFLSCQSNRFIDNSSNAFTITVNGSPQVSPAQPFTLPSSVATYGSGYFDGSGDYLSAPTSSAYQFGSGDFTLECWAYMTGASQQFLFAQWSTPNRSWVFLIRSSGTVLSFAYSTTGSNETSIDISITAQPGRWAHFAAVRNGNTLTLYMNGVAVGTGSMTGVTLYSATQAVEIGRNPEATTTWNFNGYMTDARVVKGTAVYTTTFTPPTSPLTAISGTSLLTTQYNGGGNNNGFKDSSQNNFVITRNGNTTQGTFTPYSADWSNYFDGDGDGLTSAVSAGFAFGTGDFTYEAWYYSLDTGSSQRGMFDTRVTSSSTAGVLMREDSSGFLVYVNGTTLFSVSGRVANTWQHIALVRQGSTIRFYINGVQSTSATSSQNFTDPNCRISGFIDTQASPYGYFGYISNARVVKGTCLYPSGTTFTPSITPLTAISGTSLLTCQGNRFFDASSNALAITVNGSPSVQGFSPFAPLTVYNPATNGGSGYFDGTGDYLTVPTNNAFNFTGDATCECWIYPNALSNNSQLFGFNDGVGDLKWIGVLLNSNGAVSGAATAGSGGSFTSAAGVVIIGRWHHIAWVKNGATVYLYVNGVQVASTASSNVYAYQASPLIVGRLDGSNSLCFNGIMTDLRIVNGTAVYTSAFTPPTVPLTA
jgi:hypothetical protein